RERRLDFDADLVGADFRAVMRAMHDERPDANGFQALQARRDPILFRDCFKNGAFRIRAGSLQQRHDTRAVRLLREMNFRAPAILSFESGSCGLFGIKSLREEIRNALRRRLLRREAHDMRPVWLRFHVGFQTRSTKFSTTRFSPAFSKSTVSLLPSTSVTRP